MKKLTLTIALLSLLFGGTAFGQGIPVFNPGGNVQNARGQAIAGATVTVCTGSTNIATLGTALCTSVLSKATLYSDIALTMVIANPTTTNGYGNMGPFYVAAGAYTISISGPQITTYSYPFGFIAALLFPVGGLQFLPGPITFVSLATVPRNVTFPDNQGIVLESGTVALGNSPVAINFAQTTPSQTAFSIGETTASTGASDVILGISTLAGSRATPLVITQGPGSISIPTAPDAFDLNGGTGYSQVGSNGNGGGGGGYNWSSGIGGNGGSGSGNGGAGGSWSLFSGDGGNGIGNGKVSGNAGSFTYIGGLGGSCGGGNCTGGQGGDISWEPGTGGDSTGTAANSRGGNFNLIFLGPGGGGSGAAGGPGQFNLTFATVGGNLTSCFVCMTGTWNTTGVVDAAVKVNITTTAQGAASKLMDLQSSGTPEFTVDYQGNGFLNGALSANGITNATGLQIFNTSTTCTTGASVGAICTTAAISLPVAEADTAYRVVCTGKGVTNVPVVIATTNSSGSQFTITIAALTAAAATFASYDCIAGHN